jgi:triosephosphate isomerase
MIVINFKNYTSGVKTIELAKLIRKYLPKSIICPPMLDTKCVAKQLKKGVFMQHTDYKKGRASGYVLPEYLKEYKIEGTLLNHSEHRIPYGVIKKTLLECKKIGLKVILCAGTLGEVKKFLPLKPWAIALEDKKLIGTGKSITEYNSKAVREFGKLMKGSRILGLCGAGVSDENDVLEAKKLGCDGVLIASAIAKNKNPAGLLRKLGKVKGK